MDKIDSSSERIPKRNGDDKCTSRTLAGNRRDWWNLSGKDRKLAYRREWIKEWRRNHPKEYNRIIRQNRHRRKEKVIKFYGGRCSCPGGCPVRQIEWLGIDHELNDGRKDRARFGSYQAYYSWLLKKRRKGRRVMCYNCNMARAIYGKCPHES